ncbi:hypothetical protein P153DRAFT_109333 [Dothidotthia symphoricarpi CBS 119687]|uniref:Zn(2)-C6 fungal-type domain-containing protein n=1 Tax=Dothidotthia symphoricarpi CBS 119687 TaxID=1392245 RepID=A0A6A6AUT4_9PLEO|nr:uncharacterized protein P153DRAFT_109333 [Dothidotthia symphoricarpi CBS 119687]KAF2134301.1 hypothetical protein P153DRAFT_109333 [Dothidotthia symphoricarpi CBS 119687]
MSHSGRNNSPEEDWHTLIAWTSEPYCPFFQGNAGFTGIQDGNLAASYNLPEQSYPRSAPLPIVEALPSFDYTISAPASIIGGSSSSEQVFYTSPSFDTTTSSFGDRYSGSFDACNNGLSSPGRTIDWPILDTSCKRITDSFASTQPLQTVTETALKPYIVFSGLDVSASQAFTNGGTWADQPQVIEPNEEHDKYRAGVAPIPIPQSYPQSFNDMAMQAPRSVEPQQIRSRAITIPRSHRRPAAYNSGVSHSQRVPSTLSLSPVTHRRPRSVALSRSSSQVESQNRTITSSPTSLEEGLPSRIARGRKTCLTVEQRSHAALMRVIGSCSNCKRRKGKCDPGTPCKSCVEHYKGDLVNTPCRDRILSDLSSAFLSDRLGWHPTMRSPNLFVASSSFTTSVDAEYTIPLSFGFGPAFPVTVHALHIEGYPTLIHTHVVYSWPPEPSSGCTHEDFVLPAVLTPDAASCLSQSLDMHLALLVTRHFRAFPLYCSQLQILREVYIFSQSAYSRILLQALKLLVLVHIGGDITLPAPSQSPNLARLMSHTMNYSGAEDENIGPAPCFIRSQFGAVMPGLALMYMKDVLSSLEQLLLNREPDDWPVALAVLITVLMTVESIHYHAAKMPYHSHYGSARSSDLEEDQETDDDGVRTLLDFYSACFSGCHARLRPDWEGEAQRANRADDVFVESVREVVRRASTAGYLAGKAEEKRQGDDMGFFFDRLVARLLILRL